MSWFVVDVESDGPVPGKYSMVSFGAVLAAVMARFREWLAANSQGRPIFVSDNLAFDWQWINYYFHTFLGANPFGHSGRRIGDLHCGLVKDSFAAWKHLRKTAHTHHPVDDAKGNAEALLAMKEMGLKMPSK